MIPLGVLAARRAVAGGGGETSFYGDTAAGGADASGTYNVGTLYRCNVAGDITALRYWETAPNLGTVTLRLYVDGSTTAVRTATDTAVSTRSGWRTVAITPYPVSAGQIVMAARYAPNRFQSLAFGHATETDNADERLTAVAPSTSWNGSTVGNGRYGSGDVFPTLAYQNTAYFTDLVLTY